MNRAALERNSLDYEWLLDAAKRKAESEVDVLWPDAFKEERRQFVDVLTMKFYRQMVK
jgi:hypothetical protein